MVAGALKHRLRFEARATAADEYGNERGDFAEQFTRSAEVRPRRGGETVQASLLAGTQPVNIIVRKDSETVTIAADWRAVDVNEGKTYSIRSPAADIEQKGRYLEMEAEIGVAA